MQDGTRTDRPGGDDATEGRLIRSAAVVIAVTLQRLAEDTTRFWSVDEQLVLDAMRRPTKRLHGASVGDLSDYVRSLNLEQLRGVASNVKGIYHELLFVHAENIDADEIGARVFDATNHPGADVEFIVNGETISTVQLKAVASPATVLEHLRRYPEIDILSTSEVANQLPDVASSGLSNARITDDVETLFADLPGDAFSENLVEGVATSSLVTGAITAARVLRAGRVTQQQFTAALGDVTAGAVTAIVLDALLDTL